MRTPWKGAMESRRTVGLVATAAVVILVVAGLFASGSPGTARKFRIDRDRMERLNTLQATLAAHTRENGSLPESLDRLRPNTPGAEFSEEFDPRRDPQTGEFFGYDKISDREYRICARFLTSSSDRRNEGYYGPGGDPSHKVGRNCYDRRLTTEELGRDFYPQPDPRLIPPIPEMMGSPPPPPPPSPASSPFGADSGGLTLAMSLTF
jgi:hypothetical protein